MTDQDFHTPDVDNEGVWRRARTGAALDVLFARAIADQPEYADGFGTCNFCQYAAHEGNGHAPDCVYPLAARLAEQEGEGR